MRPCRLQHFTSAPHAAGCRGFRIGVNYIPVKGRGSMIRPKLRLLSVVAVCLIGSLIGCGGGGAGRPGTPDFTLSASPSSLTIKQGGSGVSSTITVNPADGFSGSVSLSVSGVPSGVTASFNPTSTSTTSTLTLIAAGNAPTGA